MTKSLRPLTLAAALLAISAPAFAQAGHGPGGPGGPGGGPDHGGAGQITVAADGTALVVERTAATTTTAATHSLTAISPAGTTAWTWSAPAGIREVEIISGLAVVSVSGIAATTTTSAVSPQIVALNLASGAVAWTLAVDGEAGGLKATPTGLLAVITKVTASSSTTTPPTVSRSLVSISSGGKVVWTVSLD